MTVRISTSRVLGRHGLLLLCVAVTCFPVLYALLVSTFDFQQIFIYPPRLIPGTSLLENVRLAWTKVGLGRLLANSFLISISVALGKIVLAILAAFAFTYFRDFPGKN
ncbi:MAG TPA: hypothetical protein VJM10_02280, partial [Candidatus Methylomirabilis sp.]|nr:hypothetical protein [Candidatus Methylomirabilis sp.]